MAKRFALLFLLILAPLTAHAVTFRSGERLFVSVPFQDDLYIGAGTITIKEKVEGDVTVVAGEVFVQSDVGEDLNVAGGRVEIEGNVRDDLRVIGGEVRIDGTVGDDLIVLGGEIRLTENATVLGDVVMKGGTTTLNGEVKGRTDISGGTVTVNAPLQGEANVAAADLTLNELILGNATLSTRNLTLGPKARFGGDLRYWTGGGTQEFSPAILRGTATFDSSLSSLAGHDSSPSGLPGLFFTLLNVSSILSATLLILLFAFVTRTFFNACAQTLQKSPVKSFFVGLLYFTATPIVASLLLLSVIGVPIALFALFLLVFSLIFSKALTAMVLAKLYEVRERRKWSRATFVFASVVVLILLKLTVSLPFVGWALVAILTCAAFGALMKVWWQRVRRIV